MLGRLREGGFEPGDRDAELCEGDDDVGRHLPGDADLAVRARVARDRHHEHADDHETEAQEHLAGEVHRLPAALLERHPDPVEDGREQDDEERVQPLDHVRGDPVELAVVLGEERPGAARLVVDRPEEDEQAEDPREPQERLAVGGVLRLRDDRLLALGQLGRVVPLAQREDHERDRHEHRRADEGDAVAPLVAHEGDDGHRGASAEVDPGVEPAEGLRPEPPAFLGRVVVERAQHRAHVGFDDPGAHGEEPERDEEPGAARRGAEDEVSRDVGQGEVDDGLVSPEPAVSDVGADDAEQVAGRREAVVDGASLCPGEPHLIDEVEHEDGLHPVEARPLGELPEGEEPEGSRMSLLHVSAFRDSAVWRKGGIVEVWNDRA